MTMSEPPPIWRRRAFFVALVLHAVSMVLSIIGGVILGQKDTPTWASICIWLFAAIVCLNQAFNYVTTLDVLVEAAVDRDRLERRW